MRPLERSPDGATWPTEPPLVAPWSALPPRPELPRIKVLHVITRFWAGAGGNTLLSAVGMDPRRYETWVAGCPGGPLWERARRAGVGTVELRGFREVLAPTDLHVLIQLIRLIRRERFTIVHTHSAKGGFLGRLAAWLCRTPVVVHTFHGFSVHDYMSRRRRRLYLLLDRAVRRMAHEYYAVSPRVAQQAVQYRFAPPGSVSVVPSAVEVDDIPHADGDIARAREELGIPPEVPVVGTVGRIDFAKAPLDFVRMAAEVARTHPHARFMMVGDGPLQEQAQQEARRLNVDVLFTGFRADAPRIAAAFDVFVISSLYEGLGRAVTEALASGRPVVATAVNGVPDLIAAGSTGLLAPPAEPAALAECVRWMLDHPVEARRMGRQGRERVLATFAPAVMCDRLDRAYARLLGLPVPTQPSPTAAEPAAADTANGGRRDPNQRVAVHRAD
jgi:glycosyltransferase involved in cell wall biosynthesis